MLLTRSDVTELTSPTVTVLPLTCHRVVGVLSTILIFNVLKRRTESQSALDPPCSLFRYSCLDPSDRNAHRRVRTHSQDPSIGRRPGIDQVCPRFFRALLHSHDSRSIPGRTLPMACTPGAFHPPARCTAGNHPLHADLCVFSSVVLRRTACCAQTIPASHSGLPSYSRSSAAPSSASGAGGRAGCFI